jgi:uncharacterized protein YndB with AHSA1/START domain
LSEYFKHTIRHQTYIQATPEKVYDTITSGAGWNAFFTQATEVDPKAGGKIVFRWKNYGPNFYTTEAEGKVLNAERPGQFIFEWYPVGRETPTRVCFDLQAAYGGTVVRLSEDGYPDTPEGRDMILECAAGWAEALTLLKFYIESGIVYTQPKR